jgi:hypothetical protein
MKRLLAVFALCGLLLSGTLGTVSAQDATPTSSLVSGVDLGLPEYAIEITDDGFVTTAEVRAGRVLVTVTNNSSNADSTPFFLEVPEGDTVESLTTRFEEIAVFMQTGQMPASGDPLAFLYDAHSAGGPSAGPGVSGQAIVELTPGEWVIADLNFVKPPVALSVTGEMPAELPEIPANATLHLVDMGETFDYVLEGTISAGPQIVAIVNDSTQPHFTEFGLFPDGYTVTEESFAQLLMIDMGMATPDPAVELPPAEEIIWANFVGLQSPGTTQWLVADFAPGTYSTTCWVPDPRHEGTPHTAEGMYTVFTVE